MPPWRPSVNTTWMTPLPDDPALLARRKAALYSDAPVFPHGDLQPWTGTVIFAPHPDDESLGCGGLMATLTDRGQRVYVVFVSDGSMSHPNSKKFDRERRITLREQEALAACSVLGVASEDIRFLRLPDGAVPRQGSRDFDGVVASLAERLGQWQADTLVVPWRRDPHPDHRATWELCQAVTERLSRPPRWIEYPVWMWETRNAVDLPRPDEMIIWRLNVDDQLARKQRAILAHASQYAGLIDDDPRGFQLQEQMLDHFRRPYEVFFEEAAKRHRSLTGQYFERVYADADDPWKFETSPYELAKYAATLAALPADRYTSGFEIGCSIGVLTAQLAERCERLLAVDTSEAPLVRARVRLADRPQVRFRQMSIPKAFPEEDFDLVVLSEVGYYWGYEDLYRAIGLIQQAVSPGGTLLLVHYTPYVPDYPLTGDEVHEAFSARLRGFYRVDQQRADRYRLDVWKRRG